MKKLLLIFLPLIFIACTTCPECPKQVELKCPTATLTENLGESIFVHFIDVGQGDASLIKTGNTEMLIDCGKNSMGDKVVDYLKGEGVTELEFLLITHPDSDHLGGCDTVLENIKTIAVITNGEEKDTKSYEDVIAKIDTEQKIQATVGKEWTFGPGKIRVLQAYNGFDDSNQNSVVTKLTYGETEVLFTGDCDKECETLLLGKDIEADILRVVHHGTKFGTGIDLLEKVNPSIGIISVGDNAYGHPTEETLDILAQEGVIIYRTDLLGDIRIKINEKGYEVIK